MTKRKRKPLRRSCKKPKRPPYAWAAATDTGKVREENQDAFFAQPETGLFLVSDGMGGVRGGALASEIVAGVLPKMLKPRLKKPAPSRLTGARGWLQSEILRLSERLREESSGRAVIKGMGATLVLALVRGRRAYIAHMGDSRAYLYRRGRLKRLTEDHSIVEFLLKEGEITPEEAKTHPARGKLTRFIGMEGEVFPDVASVELKKGDRLLLCSDGLSGMVSDDEITAFLKKRPEPKSACAALVDAALLAGGEDNVTAVVIRYG